MPCKKIAVILLTALLLPLSAHARDFFLDGYIYPWYSPPAGNRDRKTISVYNEQYDLFTDYSGGYRLLIPAGSAADFSLASFRMAFCSPDLTVEVYYDDFTGKQAGFYELYTYSNMFLRRGGPHKITNEYHSFVNGRPAHTTAWQRAKLNRVDEDKNYYRATSVRRNNREAYTIVLKSAGPLGHRAEAIVNSFSFIPVQGVRRNYKYQHTASTTAMNELTRAAYEELFSPASGLTWGIFEPSAPRSLRRLEEKERALGHKFRILLRYQSIDEPLPAEDLDRAWQSGRLLELTLATVHTLGANALWADKTDSAFLSYAILNGQYDDYLKRYAEDLKTFGKPILFRLNNEMNGDWCWYSAYYTARDPAIYKALWRYIRTIFDQAGVDNLIWVWNPHDLSLPDFAWNNYLLYYPGDEYVDVIGLTGYNTGTYFPGEYWRGFEQIYAPLYAQYITAFDKPFMITEFSSSSVGGDKAAWIADMFAKIGNYPKIKAAVWWDGADYDRNGQPGRIYFINDTPAVTAAMRQGLSRYPGAVSSPPPAPAQKTRS